MNHDAFNVSFSLPQSLNSSPNIHQVNDKIVNIESHPEEGIANCWIGFPIYNPTHWKKITYEGGTTTILFSSRNPFLVDSNQEKEVNENEYKNLNKSGDESITQFLEELYNN